VHSRRETLTSLYGRQGTENSSLLSTLIDRTKIYEGQSLDEVALVNAARENGFSLLSRSNRFITVKMLDTNRCYQIIAENAFTPERKLMSILLKLCPLEQAMALENTDVIRHYHREKNLGKSLSIFRHLRKEKGPVKNTFSNAFTDEISDEKFPSHDLNAPDKVCPFDTPSYITRDSSYPFQARSRSPTEPNHSNNQEGILSANTKCAVKAPLLSNSPTSSSSSSSDRASASGTIMDASRSNVAVKNGSEHEHEGEVKVKKDEDESNSSSSANSAAPDGRKAQRKRRKRKQNADYQKPKKNQDSHYSVSKGDSCADSFATTKVRQNTVVFDEEGESNRNRENGAPPYLLLVKGADSSVFKILKKDSTENKKVLSPLTNNLNEAARGGLRTLVLGQRYLTENEVREWLPKWESAANSMVDRHEKLSEAYKLIERDIELVGSTSVEDKLQDEVPETLQFFRDASIVVWMLTGDKRETAVRIAITSGLVDSGQEDCFVHLNVEEAGSSMCSSSNVTEKQKDAALPHNREGYLFSAEKLFQDSGSPTHSQGSLNEGNDVLKVPPNESSEFPSRSPPFTLQDSTFSTVILRENPSQEIPRYHVKKQSEFLQCKISVLRPIVPSDRNPLRRNVRS